jgi:hypothetical protein
MQDRANKVIATLLRGATMRRQVHDGLFKSLKLFCQLPYAASDILLYHKRLELRLPPLDRVRRFAMVAAGIGLHHPLHLPLAINETNVMTTRSQRPAI